MSSSWKTSSTDVAVSAVEKLPTKVLLVTCRSLTEAENKILSGIFKTILVFNAQLSGYDLATLNFDLLLLDISDRANHVFLEMASPAAAPLGVSIVVLKKAATNYAALAEALGSASVISSIADFSAPDFMKFLAKKRLPKFEGRCVHFLGRLWDFVTK